MKHGIRFLILTLAALISVATEAHAHALTMIQYHQDLESIVTCPAGYDCSISLDQGERINDIFLSDVQAWDPHTTYVGEHNPRPYLILSPNKPRLRTTMVITTSRRAYYFLLISSDADDPQHYALTFPDNLSAYRLAKHVADVARSAVVIARPDPSNCRNDHYAIDRLRVFFYPAHVCNDGQHTFIILQPFRETPSDLPVLFSIVDGKQSITNYVYDASRFRYVVDGVPTEKVLVTGSGKQKKTMHIQHIAATDKKP